MSPAPADASSHFTQNAETTLKLTTLSGVTKHLWLLTQKERNRGAITSRYVDSGRSRDVPVPWLASAPSVLSCEAEAAAAVMSGVASAGRDASSCRCTPGSLSDSSGDSSPALLAGFSSPVLLMLLGPLFSPSPLLAPLSVLLARHWSAQGVLEGTQVATVTKCRA